MGIFNNGTTTVQQQRARVQFSASGETDNGLSFGTSFRVTADTTSSAAATGTAAVFVSGAFGKLSFGPDNSNALAATTHNVPHLGVLENAGGSRRTALGTGNNILYTYSAGDLSLAVSTGDISDMSNQYSVAAKYTIGDFSFGIGYETRAAVAAVNAFCVSTAASSAASTNNTVTCGSGFTTVSAGSAAVDADTHLLLSASGKFDNLSLVGYTGRNDDGDNQMGLSAAYAMDAVTVTVRLKNDFGDDTHMGAGVVYNLGGGARIGGSVNNVENGDTTLDLGMSFAF